MPLVFADRLVGLLIIDDPGERREFAEREIGLVERIVAQAAAAIENARLHEEVAVRERFAAALNEIDAVIHSTLKVEEIMQRVVAYAVDAVGADSAMVALRHGDDWVAEYGHPEVPGVLHESVRSDEAPFMIEAVTKRRAGGHRRLRDRPALHPRGAAALRRALRAVPAADRPRRGRWASSSSTTTAPP